MPNERLKMSVIETSGIQIVVFPQIDAEGDIRWVGEVSMPPHLTLIHINACKSREHAFEVTFRALRELIGRLLGFTKTLVDRGIVTDPESPNLASIIALAHGPNEENPKSESKADD